MGRFDQPEHRPLTEVEIKKALEPTILEVEAKLRQQRIYSRLGLAIFVTAAGLLLSVPFYEAKLDRAFDAGLERLAPHILSLMSHVDDSPNLMYLLSTPTPEASRDRPLEIGPRDFNAPGDRDVRDSFFDTFSIGSFLQKD